MIFEVFLPVLPPPASLLLGRSIGFHALGQGAMTSEELRGGGRLCQRFYFIFFFLGGGALLKVVCLTVFRRVCLIFLEGISSGTTRFGKSIPLTDPTSF